MRHLARRRANKDGDNGLANQQKDPDMHSCTRTRQPLGYTLMIATLGMTLPVIGWYHFNDDSEQWFNTALLHTAELKPITPATIDPKHDSENHSTIAPPIDTRELAKLQHRRTSISGLAYR